VNICIASVGENNKDFDNQDARYNCKNYPRHVSNK